MFKLDPSPTFWADVRLSVPGEKEPVTIRMQFAHKTVDDLKAWIEAARDTKDGDAVCGVVRDWQGVDAPYSEDAMRKLLRNYPASAAEVLQQYMRALTESRAKN